MSKKNQKPCLPELVNTPSVEQTIEEDKAVKSWRENSWMYQERVKPFISVPRKRTNLKTPQVR